MVILETFIEVVKDLPTSIKRGTIIDLLFHTKTKWSNVIRALILGSTALFIHRPYVLEKLNFCLRNPTNPECFLDLHRTKIFKALENK